MGSECFFNFVGDFDVEWGLGIIIVEGSLGECGNYCFKLDDYSYWISWRVL